MSKFAVLGPGGVGGFLAAALTRAGEEVTVVAREETAAAIARGGIEVQSAILGRFTARPAATPRLEMAPDVLIVATKAAGLDGAVERIAADPPLVVPLLNGLDHLTALRRRWGTVAAGVIRIESERRSPGQIVQSSPVARVDLAAKDPALRPRLPALAAALERAGLAVRLEESEAQVMWSKLARLNALALTTSASDRPIGFVREEPEWRAALEAVVTETVAVANADGAGLDREASLAELLDAPGELGSSMRRDIAGGREPELDAIAGAVLRAGARHGLECRTVARLAGLVAGRAGIRAPAV